MREQDAAEAEVGNEGRVGVGEHAEDVQRRERVECLAHPGGCRLRIDVWEPSHRVQRRATSPPSTTSECPVM